MCHYLVLVCFFVESLKDTFLSRTIDGTTIVLELTSNSTKISLACLLPLATLDTLDSTLVDDTLEMMLTTLLLTVVKVAASSRCVDVSVLLRLCVRSEASPLTDGLIDNR